jgi:hypothetical protein
MEGHIRYEVIKLNWLIYIVQRVSADGDYRDTLHWFFTLNRAEACAKGLAFRTWCNDGPIMASFVAYIPLNQAVEDAGPEYVWPQATSPDRITEKFPIVTTTEEQHDQLPH